MAELPQLGEDEALMARWTEIRSFRAQVTEAIEPLRREKTVRSSNEAR